MEYVGKTERITSGETERFPSVYSMQTAGYSTAVRDLLIVAAESILRHWQNIAILIGVVCLIYAMSKSARPIPPDPAWQAPVVPASVSGSYNDNSINVCFMQCR